MVRAHQQINPQRPIPPTATAAHGIHDEHLAHCPPFRETVPQLAQFIDDADLSGFGIARFDLPFLVAEFERAGWTFPLHGRKGVDALTLLLDALADFLWKQRPR